MSDLGEFHSPLLRPSACTTPESFVDIGQVRP